MPLRGGCSGISWKLGKAAIVNNYQNYLSFEKIIYLLKEIIYLLKKIFIFLKN